MSPEVLSNALWMFTKAQQFMLGSPYVGELRQQQSASFEKVSESDFLREYAWVVLCSGFREKTIRTLFPHLSLCFCDWEAASLVVEHEHLCRSTALEVFRHAGKIEAILRTARRVADVGYPEYHCYIAAEPVIRLQELPYIGPVTAFHLAKNLGFDTAKPDRHLERLAALLGFKDAHHLCGELSRATGHSKAVIDIILWRYCEQFGMQVAESFGNSRSDG